MQGEFRRNYLLAQTEGGRHSVSLILDHHLSPAALGEFETAERAQAFIQQMQALDALHPRQRGEG